MFNFLKNSKKETINEVKSIKYPTYIHGLWDVNGKKIIASLIQTNTNASIIVTDEGVTFLSFLPELITKTGNITDTQRDWINRMDNDYPVVIVPELSLKSI